MGEAKLTSEAIVARAEVPQVCGCVVVGIDGSAPALAAARWAAQWAGARREKLVMIAVAPRRPVPTRTGALRAMLEDGDFAERVTRSSRAHLDTALTDLRTSHPGVAVEGVLLEGHPVEVLARLSATATTTVLGATGAGGVRGAVLGGTVAGVLHQAAGSVVVLPPSGGDPEGPVVVGLDGGDASSRVARAAIDAAAALGRRLVAVHAWDVEPAVTTYGPLAFLAKDEREIEADSRQLLAELTSSAAQAADAEVAVEFVVRWGRPGPVLAELAASAALVVVGSRGLGGFPGLLLGSVSRALTHHPRCPTLVVRP